MSLQASALIHVEPSPELHMPALIARGRKGQRFASWDTSQSTSATRTRGLLMRAPPRYFCNGAKRGGWRSCLADGAPPPQRCGDLDRDRLSHLSSGGDTDYLTNGGRIEVAQKMAGHSNAKTTGRYDRRTVSVCIGRELVQRRRRAGTQTLWLGRTHKTGA